MSASAGHERQVLMRTSPKSYTREQHIHSLNTALAFCQGHPWPEARRRATLQQDLDDALSSRQLTILDGIDRAGHPLWIGAARDP